MIKGKIFYTDAILLKIYTKAEWTSKNPVLQKGEMGLESDTLRMKIGNGSAKWSALNYTDKELRDRIESLEAFVQSTVQLVSSVLNNSMH